MIKQFTYQAPRKFREGDQSDLIDIISSYKGSESIWIYVEKDTGKNPTFVSEGDLPDPTTTEKLRSVKLSADNDNHILLMDLLSTSRGHNQTEEITETIIAKGDIAGAPNFQMSFTDLKYHPASEYYDLSETHVSETGVVTYKLMPNFDITWEGVIDGINFMLSQSEEKTRDPLVLETPAALARYQRHIAVLTHIKDNIANTVCPLKVPVPMPHEV